MDLIREVAHGCMEQGDAKFSKLQEIRTGKTTETDAPTQTAGDT